METYASGEHGSMLNADYSVPLNKEPSKNAIKVTCLNFRLQSYAYFILDSDLNFCLSTYALDWAEFPMGQNWFQILAQAFRFVDGSQHKADGYSM